MSFWHAMATRGEGYDNQAMNVACSLLVILSRIYSERNHEWTRINTNFRGKIEIFRSTEEGHYLVTRSDTQRLLDFHSCLFVSIRGSNCIVTAEPRRGDGPRKHIGTVRIPRKDPTAGARSLSVLWRIGMRAALFAT
jgi:hypothetical protein